MSGYYNLFRKNGQLYQACQNKFLIVVFEGDSGWQNNKKLRRTLCNVGKENKVDSVLVLMGNPWEFSSQGFHCTMEVFEPRADSISTMCGNGIRAVCKYWIDQGYRVKIGDKFYISTGSGIRKVTFLGNDVFKVDMGLITQNQKDLKKYVKVRQIDGLLDKIPDGLKIKEAIIGMTGNKLDGKIDGEPHLIFFLENHVSMERLRSLTTQLGKIFTNDKQLFPLEMNTSFVVENSEGISICTYERGVYYVTNSCGTAATVAGAYLLKRTDVRRIYVDSLGGRLQVEVDIRGMVYLTGDASSYN